MKNSRMYLEIPAMESLFFCPLLSVLHRMIVDNLGKITENIFFIK